MHDSNRRWWASMAEAYPEHFRGEISVVEFGSFNVCGTIRDHFGPVDCYLGIDWRPGPLVDLVSLAHEAPIPRASFDTVVSASMLEHDPHWSRSLARMAYALKTTGALFLTWGSATNLVHELHSAPDGGFHARPAGQVIEALRRLGLAVQSFEYEDGKYGQEMGFSALHAWRDPTRLVGSPQIADLLPEDRE